MSTQPHEEQPDGTVTPVDPSDLPNPMASYTLSIRSDTGYSATTKGRCTAEQYGAAMAALHDAPGTTNEKTNQAFALGWYAAAADRCKRADVACEIGTADYIMTRAQYMNRKN